MDDFAYNFDVKAASIISIGVNVAQHLSRATELHAMTDVYARELPGNAAIRAVAGHLADVNLHVNQMLFQQ